MSDLRADPRARVLTALELAYDEPLGTGTTTTDLGALLRLLGLREADTFGSAVGLAVEQLVELEDYRRDLETRGRDALDEDSIPRGVSATRVLESELEATAGRVLELVDELAAQLPR